MAPRWAQLWFVCRWDAGGARGGRHCFSAETSTVGVDLFSQLLLVRNEDPQGILRGLHGYAAGAFSARDVLVGSGFASVDAVELTYYCCCQQAVPRHGLSMVFLVGRVVFTLERQHGDSGAPFNVISLWREETVQPSRELACGLSFWVTLS